VAILLNQIHDICNSSPCRGQASPHFFAYLPSIAAGSDFVFDDAERSIFDFVEAPAKKVAMLQRWMITLPMKASQWIFSSFTKVGQKNPFSNAALILLGSWCSSYSGRGFAKLQLTGGKLSVARCIKGRRRESSQFPESDEAVPVTVQLFEVGFRQALHAPFRQRYSPVLICVHLG